MPGDAFIKACGCESSWAYMWSHPGKQPCSWARSSGSRVLSGPTTAALPDWGPDAGLGSELHLGISVLVGDLNRIYRSSPAPASRGHRSDGFTGSTPTTPAGT